jgi:glutathione peroxidase
MNDFYNTTKQDTVTVTEQIPSLLEYVGKVVVLVNTASKCGFTKYYAGFEELYKTYKEKGLEIVAFPTNNFGAQEPGTDDEIKTFCETTYNVTFPIMPKSDITTNPVYLTLLKATGKQPKWNFHKFIISKDGLTITSIDHFAEPHDLIPIIEGLLNK